MEIKTTLPQASVFDTKSKISKKTSDEAIQTATPEEQSTIDTNKVQALKEQIQNGDYKFNLEGIANAIRDLND